MNPKLTRNIKILVPLLSDNMGLFKKRRANNYGRYELTKADSNKGVLKRQLKNMTKELRETISLKNDIIQMRMLQDELNNMSNQHGLPNVSEEGEMFDKFLKVYELSLKNGKSAQPPGDVEITEQITDEEIDSIISRTDPKTLEMARNAPEHMVIEYIMKNFDFGEKDAKRIVDRIRANTEPIKKNRSELDSGISGNIETDTSSPNSGDLTASELLESLK